MLVYVVSSRGMGFQPFHPCVRDIFFHARTSIIIVCTIFKSSVQVYLSKQSHLRIPRGFLKTQILL